MITNILVFNQTKPNQTKPNQTKPNQTTNVLCASSAGLRLCGQKKTNRTNNDLSPKLTHQLLIHPEFH